MSVLTGVLIGNAVRKRQEREKLEQAQQYQQTRQQPLIYIPDQFIFTSQVPLSINNRLYSPTVKFGSGTREERLQSKTKKKSSFFSIW